MAEQQEPISRPVPTRIGIWNRAALVVLGLAGLGSGGTAVFITHLEAGPVALLVIGLILLLVGMSGRMPTRLKVGDNEAAWEVEREAVQVFVERVAEDAPAESQPELLEALGTLAESAPRAASAGITAVAYERMVLAEIEKAISELRESDPAVPPIKFGREFLIRGRMLDGFLEGPNGRLVALDIKYSSSTESATSAILTKESLPDLPVGESSGSVLLITRTPLTRAARRQLTGFSDIDYVTFAGAQDQKKLVDALRRVTYE